MGAPIKPPVLSRDELHARINAFRESHGRYPDLYNVSDLAVIDPVGHAAHLNRMTTLRRKIHRVQLLTVVILIVMVTYSTYRLAMSLTPPSTAPRVEVETQQSK